jgi:hypothetical protein
MSKPKVNQGKAEKGNRYRDVSQMVRDVLGDEERDFADELEKQLARRQIVKYLLALRASQAMSPQDSANR